jgi:hypothetical protein
METYPRAAMERAMKVQDVVLQAMAKKTTFELLPEEERDPRPLITENEVAE